MCLMRRSRVEGWLGAALALSSAPALAHQVIGVEADPGLPVRGECVRLTVEGLFGDGCARTTSATAQIADHRLVISIVVLGPNIGAVCPAVVTPFRQTIELAGLAAGNYIIDVELFLHEFGQEWTETFPAVGELFVHQARVRYELLSESWFMDDCPICDHIPIQLPVKGTFELLVVGPGAVFNFYSIRNVLFEAEGYTVRGCGAYQYSLPELSGRQSMCLDVAVNKEEGLILESGLVPLSATTAFPSMDIELAERTDSIARVYRLRIVVSPVITSQPDLDDDGDVDGDDLATFQGCLTGPELGPPRLDCEPADFDQDGDVDQEDFGAFQRCYSGADESFDPMCRA